MAVAFHVVSGRRVSRLSVHEDPAERNDLWSSRRRSERGGTRSVDRSPRCRADRQSGRRSTECRTSTEWSRNGCRGSARSAVSRETPTTSSSAPRRDPDLDSKCPAIGRDARRSCLAEHREILHQMLTGRAVVRAASGGGPTSAETSGHHGLQLQCLVYAEMAEGRFKLLACIDLLLDVDHPYHLRIDGSMGGSVQPQGEPSR